MWQIIRDGVVIDNRVDMRYVKGGFTKPKLSTKLKNWWRYRVFGQVAETNKGEVIMPIKEYNNDRTGKNNAANRAI